MVGASRHRLGGDDAARLRTRCWRSVGCPQKLIWQIPAVVSHCARAFVASSRFMILPAHMSMVRGRYTAAGRSGPSYFEIEEALSPRASIALLPNRGQGDRGPSACFFLAVVVLIVPRIEFEFFPQESSQGFSRSRFALLPGHADRADRSGRRCDPGFSCPGIMTIGSSRPDFSSVGHIRIPRLSIASTVPSENEAA